MEQLILIFTSITSLYLIHFLFSNIFYLFKLILTEMELLSDVYDKFIGIVFKYYDIYCAFLFISRYIFRFLMKMQKIHYFDIIFCYVLSMEKELKNWLINKTYKQNNLV